MAGEDTTHHHVGERLDRGEESIDRARSGDLLVDQLVPIGIGRLAAEGAMESERDAGLGGAGIERVVVRRVVRLNREAGNEEGLGPFGEPAIELSEAYVEPVIDRQHRQADNTTTART